MNPSLNPSLNPSVNPYQSLNPYQSPCLCANRHLSPHAS